MWRVKPTTERIIEIIRTVQHGYTTITVHVSDQIKSWRLLKRITNNGKVRQPDSATTRKLITIITKTDILKYQLWIIKQ